MSTLKRDSEEFQVSGFKPGLGSVSDQVCGKQVCGKEVLA